MTNTNRLKLKCNSNEIPRISTKLIAIMIVIICTLFFSMIQNRKWINDTQKLASFTNCNRTNNSRTYEDRHSITDYAVYRWLCSEDVAFDLVAKDQPDSSSMILRSYCLLVSLFPLNLLRFAIRWFE